MKLFLVPIFTIGAVSWIIFGYLVWNTPPKIDGQLVLSNISYTIFSAAVALSLSTSLVLYFIGDFFRTRARGVDPTSQSKRLLLRSLRRGFLFTLTLTAVVILNVADLLNLLNAGLVIGIAALAEIYFSSR